MEKCCLKKNEPLKILLTVDNVPGHSSFTGDLHSNIKAVFPSPKTTSLIQSMDQVVIAVFKAYDLRRTFAQATAATEEDTHAILG